MFKIFQSFLTFNVLILILSVCSCSHNRAPDPNLTSSTPVQRNDKTQQLENSQEHPTGKAVDGQASVYSDKLHGKKTSSGEIYDKNKLTAASKTLPVGSMAKVTNIKTNKSATVKINDKGPFTPGRVIDLSEASAKSINMDTKGTAQVKVEPVTK